MFFVRVSALAACIACAGLGLSAGADAQAISIAGAWSGNGTVTLPSGSSEKVRCQATFRQSGNSASMSATCASPSTRVKQTAELSRVAANRFSGDFNNPEYGITGSIRIVVNGNTLNASMSGGGGSAIISLSR
jgi:hypothetical protein